MRPVRRTPALLLVALFGGAVVAGRLLPPLFTRMDAQAPRVGWAAPFALLLGAMIVGVLAHNTWQSLHKKNQRMTSEHGIRMLALGKASAMVGALVAGGYGGYALAFADALNSPLGRERFWHSVAAAVAGLLLMVAALLLEWACHLPDDDDEGTAKKAGSTDPAPA